MNYKNTSTSPAWRKTKQANDLNRCEWMTKRIAYVIWKRHSKEKGALLTQSLLCDAPSAAYANAVLGNEEQQQWK